MDVTATPFGEEPHKRNLKETSYITSVMTNGHTMSIKRRQMDQLNLSPESKWWRSQTYDLTYFSK